MVWSGRDFRRAGFRSHRGPYALGRLRPARDPAAGSQRLRRGRRPARALARQPVTITASPGLGDDSDISSAEPEKMRAGERLLGKALHLDTYHMNIEESDLFSPVLD